MRKSSGVSPQNFRGVQMIAADAIYRERICDVLKQRYGAMRHGKELLARMASVTPKTAENWLRGICAPQGASLVRMIAHCEDVAAEVTRLIDEIKKEAD